MGFRLWLEKKFLRLPPETEQMNFIPLPRNIGVSYITLEVAALSDMGENEWETMLEKYGLKVEDIGTKEDIKRRIEQPISDILPKCLEESIQREELLMHFFEDKNK